VKRHFNAASLAAGIIQSVEDSSKTINIGASEINQASIDLASRTETGAARLEQTASAMNSVTGLVRQTARTPPMPAAPSFPPTSRRWKAARSSAMR
jgi:methyl-accepting chemotaxis protein